MKTTVEYSIEHKTSCGEWVEEGLFFDTYEDALKQLKELPTSEKFRIVEEYYTVRWERSK